MQLSEIYIWIYRMIAATMKRNGIETLGVLAELWLFRQGQSHSFFLDVTGIIELAAAAVDGRNEAVTSQWMKQINSERSNRVCGATMSSMAFLTFRWWRDETTDGIVMEHVWALSLQPNHRNQTNPTHLPPTQKQKMKQDKEKKTSTTPTPTKIQKSNYE